MGPHISVAELSSTLAKTAKEIDSEKAVSSVFVFHLTSGSWTLFLIYISSTEYDACVVIIGAAGCCCSQSHVWFYFSRFASIRFYF